MLAFFCNMQKRIGVHVSISKGLVEALEKAQAMGANCIQIFSSPPQSFIPPKFSDADCAAFKKRAIQLDILPVFIHATYLVNLGSDKDTLLKLSIKSLMDDLNFAGKIGAKGVIVHTGSHKGKGFMVALPTVVNSIKEILSGTPEATKLYLEIASGGGGKIGSTFAELKALLDGVKTARLGICLDTAHMFAAGYAFDTTEKVAALEDKITATVGWEKVECMHANDSKVELGSGRDRHENIGKGLIGKKPLQLLLRHEKFGKLPWILETPGFADKGPDKQNLDILKSLV